LEISQSSGHRICKKDKQALVRQEIAIMGFKVGPSTTRQQHCSQTLGKAKGSRTTKRSTGRTATVKIESDYAYTWFHTASKINQAESLHREDRDRAALATDRTLRKFTEATPLELRGCCCCCWGGGKKASACLTGWQQTKTRLT